LLIVAVGLTLPGILAWFVVFALGPSNGCLQLYFIW